jgi:outer membrane lipoprotein-sorting protein
MHSKLGRSLTLAALALGFSAGGAAAQQALPPAKQIVDRYVEAIGGRAALARHDFRHMVAEMSIPANGMTMTMDMKYARPNKFAMKMAMPGMGSMTAGFDGQVGWSVNPMAGPQLQSGKELAQTRRMADMDANMDLAKLFPTMETVERSTSQDRPCNRVRMVSAEADTAFACFDVETGLLSTMESKQASQMGEMAVVARFEDYRDFGGIKMPARTVTSMMGQEMIVTVKSVSTAPIPASEFALPPEVRALAGQQPAPKN